MQAGAKIVAGSSQFQMIKADYGLIAKSAIGGAKGPMKKERGG